MHREINLSVSRIQLTFREVAIQGVGTHKHEEEGSNNDDRRTIRNYNREQDQINDYAGQEAVEAVAGSQCQSKR